jgi:hypothetical protein
MGENSLSNVGGSTSIFEEIDEDVVTKILRSREKGPPMVDL